MSTQRNRWAAIGAAVAVTLGAGGGIGLVDATVNSGDRAVFVPITACRILDTRPAFQVGPRATPIGAGETHTVTAHGTSGDCTIPSDALGLSMNVTAVNATDPTFLTVWAAGLELPDASSLNPLPGDGPTPNAVTTDLSADGEFSIYNLAGEVHVFADVNGYYADHIHDDRYYTEGETNARFVPIRPKDVRIGPFEMRPITEGTTWAFSVGWTHTAGGTQECISAPIELAPRVTVTRMQIVYAAPAGAPVVSASLSGIKGTPGPVAGGSHVAALGLDTLATTTTDFEAYDVKIQSDADIRDGYHYGVAVCTEDDLTIVGIRVFLT